MNFLLKEEPEDFEKGNNFRTISEQFRKMSLLIAREEDWLHGGDTGSRSCVAKVLYSLTRQ